MMSGLTLAFEVYHAVSSPAPGLLRELRTISMDDRSATSCIWRHQDHGQASLLNRAITST